MKTIDIGAAPADYIVIDPVGRCLYGLGGKVIDVDQDAIVGTVDGGGGGTALGDSLAAVEHLTSGVPIPYGLGLYTDEYAGQHRIWHNGIWAGYRAIIMRFPAARVTIISLCNSAYVVSETMADAVADIVLPAQPGGTRATAPRVRLPDADQLAGTYYSNQTNQRVTIVVDSGAPALAGSPLIPLSPVASIGVRRFRLPTGPAVIRFEPATGSAQRLYSETDGRVSTYFRVQPALQPSSYGEYAGRYRSNELGVEWTVVVKDGAVSIRDERGEDTPFQPIFRDAFAGPGSVRVERTREGIVTALTMTTAGVYRLVFDRVP